MAVFRRRDRLNDIPGMDFPEDGIGRRPSLPMVALEQRVALDQLWESATGTMRAPVDWSVVATACA